MKIDWGKRDPHEGRVQLANWISARPGVTEAAVLSWSTPRAGHSYETVFCRVHWTENDCERDEELVLRIQRNEYSLFPNVDLFLQSDVMMGLKRYSDVPVPSIYWTEREPTAMGAPFFVMGHVNGNVPPDLISRRSGNFVDQLSFAQRQKVYGEGLVAMAAIHNVDWRRGFTFLEGKGRGELGLDRYLFWVEDWYRWGAAGQHFELIEQGLRYLRDHQPSGIPIGIVWGDARPGNMIFRDDLKPAAVIDWEMTALGPAEVDLGWWVMWETIWNSEGSKPECEGFLSRDQMIDRYGISRREPVRHYEYFELLAAIRLAIMIMIGVRKRIEAGLLPPNTTAGSNNLATRLIAKLLGQKIPEPSPDDNQLGSEMGD